MYFEDLNPDFYEIKQTQTIDYKKIMSDFKTPAQIVRAHKLEWTAQIVGILAHAGLVRSYKAMRNSLVSESDVLRIYSLRIAE